MDGSNFTEFDIANDSSLAEDQFYVNLISAARCSLSILAIIFNSFVILLFASHACLRLNKINWAVCNLMCSNILMCSMLAIYSMIKLIDDASPHSRGGCLALNWFMVVVSFGPTWSISLMASLRTLSFCSSKEISDRMTLRKLIGVRCVMAMSDIIMATLIIGDVSQLSPDSLCAYQSLLDSSLFYVVYNLLVGFVLLIAGLSSLISRTYHRSRILSIAQQSVIESTVGVKGKCEQTGREPAVVPSILWRKPKFLMLFCVLAILFCYPRIAFVIRDKRIFWQTATLCPPAIALLFACVFCTIPKDFRAVSRQWLLDVFSVRWIKRRLADGDYV